MKIESSYDNYIIKKLLEILCKDSVYWRGPSGKDIFCDLNWEGVSLDSVVRRSGTGDSVPPLEITFSAWPAHDGKRYITGINDIAGMLIEYYELKDENEQLKKDLEKSHEEHKEEVAIFEEREKIIVEELDRCRATNDIYEKELFKLLGELARKEVSIMNLSEKLSEIEKIVSEK